MNYFQYVDNTHLKQMHLKISQLYATMQPDFWGKGYNWHWYATWPVNMAIACRLQLL